MKIIQPEALCFIFLHCNAPLQMASLKEKWHCIYRVPSRIQSLGAMLMKGLFRIKNWEDGWLEMSHGSYQSVILKVTLAIGQMV
jgi:hypothetical protein